MANNLADEDRIYQLIEKGEATIHPEVWKLLSHHIGNDLQVIYISLQVLLSTPAWILKTATFIINLLCKLCICSGRARDITKISNCLFTRAKNIDNLLHKLRTRLNKQTVFSEESQCLLTKAR